jgi:hypothetical protein
MQTSWTLLAALLVSVNNKALYAQLWMQPFFPAIVRFLSHAACRASQLSADAPAVRVVRHAAAGGAAPSPVPSWDRDATDGPPADPELEVLLIRDNLVPVRMSKGAPTVDAHLRFAWFQAPAPDVADGFDTSVSMCSVCMAWLCGLLGASQLPTEAVVRASGITGMPGVDPAHMSEKQVCVCVCVCVMRSR